VREATGNRIGVDVGGTFTDVVYQRGSDPVQVVKVLSTPDPADGLMAGLQELATENDQALDELLGNVDLLIYGTTIATNAVLTQRGARTLLLTTSGLRDALEMLGGIRERPFDNWFVKPAPLVPRHRRIGVEGRLHVNGSVRTPLDTTAVARAISENDGDIDAVAICFMHSHARPTHEDEAAAVVRRGAKTDLYLTTSSRLLPQMGFEARLHTATMNSYVGPSVRDHVGDITNRLACGGLGGHWLVMQSNGGTVAPALSIERPVVTLLSGPAAAPLSSAAVAQRLGFTDCLSVDMGGTSFDIAVIEDGAPRLGFDGRIAHHHVGVPMLDIHTIGAGGGSIGWVDRRGILRMGPESAGSNPGPAAYGRGGSRPTSTDANIVLGYLSPESFSTGGIQLDPGAAAAAIHSEVGQPLGIGIEEAAAGMFHVTIANMAAGIREVTTERGIDARPLPLIAGGGAGPLHAAAVAEELGIGTVVIPTGSAALSAIGMLTCDLTYDIVRAHAVVLGRKGQMQAVVQAFREIEEEASRALVAQSATDTRIKVDFSADMRYEGQFHHVAVPLPPVGDLSDSVMRERLDSTHQRLYGYSLHDVPSQVINLRVHARARSGDSHSPSMTSRREAPREYGSRRAYLPRARTFRSIPVLHAATAESNLVGPVLLEAHATTVLVPDRWRVTVSPDVGLVLRRLPVAGAES